jgi:predicted nucleic acid-binding protein
MSYLIDTNLISRCHKRSVPAKLESWLQENEAECFISAVTIAEMRFGVEKAAASHQGILAQRVAETELDFAEAIEPVDLDCLVQWKRVFDFLKKSKRTVACEDALLAAQCLANGHTLATENTKDFALLKPLGLKTENPLA